MLTAWRSVLSTMTSYNSSFDRNRKPCEISQQLYQTFEAVKNIFSRVFIVDRHLICDSAVPPVFLHAEPLNLAKAFLRFDGLRASTC